MTCAYPEGSRTVIGLLFARYRRVIDVTYRNALRSVLFVPCGNLINSRLRTLRVSGGRVLPAKSAMRTTTVVPDRDGMTPGA